jgi:hypothetical protein
VAVDEPAAIDPTLTIEPLTPDPGTVEAPAAEETPAG